MPFLLLPFFVVAAFFAGAATAAAAVAVVAVVAVEGPSSSVVSPWLRSPCWRLRLCVDGALTVRNARARISARRLPWDEARFLSRLLPRFGDHCDEKKKVKFSDAVSVAVHHSLAFYLSFSLFQSISHFLSLNLILSLTLSLSFSIFLSNLPISSIVLTHNISLTFLFKRETKKRDAS